jgi:hypothetical protein
LASSLKINQPEPKKKKKEGRREKTPLEASIGDRFGGVKEKRGILERGI